MRAASQHELMRKVPIGWGYDIKTFIGALRPSSTTALDFTPADTWFFRQWRRRMNTGAGTTVCSLLKPRGTDSRKFHVHTFALAQAGGWCRRRSGRSRWRDHWRRESAPQAISPSRKCAPAPFLSQTKRAVASWAFSGGFPTHGDDIPLRARPRQLVMREATEPRRSAPISG